MTRAEKERRLEQKPRCYVCDGLGLPHSNFDGYAHFGDIQFDHWLAQGLVGDRQADLVANQYPVHAARDGVSCFEDGYDTAARRNCHKGKGNKYTGQEWIEYIKIHRKASNTRFSDDLLPGRSPDAAEYKAHIVWDDQRHIATFQDREYPVMHQ